MEADGEFPETQLAQIAAELRALSHRSNWSRTLSTGEIVLTHFFCGNVERWKTQRRDKDESIRRLARRPDCPLGKSALSEAVGVYVICQELPFATHDLTPSHVASVLSLAAAQREQMLRRAIVAKLSVRELRAEVLSLRQREGERRGRPRLSPARAGLSHLRKGLEALETACELFGIATEVDARTFAELELALCRIQQNAEFIGERALSLSSPTLGPNIRSAPTASLVVPSRDERKLAV